MSVIFLLVPLSIVLGACFLGGFIWAVRSGQYEDTCTPSMRLLMDDPEPKSNPEIDRFSSAKKFTITATTADSRELGIVGADVRRLTFSKHRDQSLLTSAPTILEGIVTHQHPGKK